MRKALGYLLAIAAIAAAASAGERKSWNKVRYVGGTLPIKASAYDWSTTVTITSNPDTVELTIAPSSVFAHQQKMKIKPSSITAVISGPGAWQRVADADGAHLVSKPPSLFGLLAQHAFLGIFYEGDDGKPAAILLESYFIDQIGRILEAVTGKPVVYAR